MKTLELKNPLKDRDDKKYLTHKCVEALIKHDHYWFEPNSETLYAFNKKHYREIPDIAIQKKLMAILDEDAKRPLRNTILEEFKTRVSTSSLDAMTPPKGLINLDNGILDVKTRIMQKHDPSYYFFNSIPLNYDSSSQCPRWLEFLNEIFLERESLIQVAQELFGYCLMPGNWRQVAFILHGEGANGKSVMMEVLRELLGVDNTTSLSIQDLNHNFRKIELMNKLASICDESPTGKAMESDIFKNLVGEGMAIAERKHQNPIQFRNQAKLIFATNKVPTFKDHTYAFYRRLMVIPFDYTVSKSKKDTRLAEKLKEELGGILNWALDGLDRLLKNDSFTHSQFIEDAAKQFKMESDTVVSFIDQDCNICNSQFVLSDDLYLHYRQYCTQSGYRACAQNEFGKRIKTHYPNIERVRDGANSDGKRPYKYVGLNLRGDIRRMSKLQKIKRWKANRKESDI